MIKTGTYTPVFADLVNVNTIISNNWNYFVVGDVVYFFGACSIDVTDFTLASSFTVTIPIDGTGFIVGNAGTDSMNSVGGYGSLMGVVGTKVSVYIKSPANGALSWQISGSYRID